jgi:serine/threonine-protein kinase
MRRASRLNLAAQTGADSVPRRRARTKGPMIHHDGGERRGADPWLGKLVGGRYRVEEILGRGGMGVVYKIKHQRMGKIAAMKVLHADLAQDPEVVGRFEREAEAVSRLAHPNTVQVFDFGTEGGALYLVMEFVRGQDLGALIDRDGPMSFQELAPLLGQMCGSLEEAHDLGVVHRDLKPENILVSRTHSGQDFVKVLDFGLAKLSEREETSSVTSAGSIVGTPYYMSPEQIRADVEVDHRADIYSFGALLYRLLTAENAFNAKTPVGVLTKHLTEEIAAPSVAFPALDIPPEVDQIVARCMAKAPTDRYTNIRELLEDIEQLYTSLFVSSSAIQRPPTQWLASPDGELAPVAAMLEIQVDHGIEANLRLRREDFDVFEKKLRRTRVARLIFIPTFLLAMIAAAAYFVFLRAVPVYKAEREPNNTLDTATLVAANSEVTGHIGKRVSKSEPDVDFYRFTTKPEEEVVTLSVDAPANIDIRLNLYDMSGKLIKDTNEFGTGKEEQLRRWRSSRAVAVSVAGVFTEGSGLTPVENVSDRYTLSVVFAPHDSRLESEPNDSRTDANTIAPNTPITGYLDHREDTDVYRVDAAAGEYKLLVSGGPDVPFEWRLNDEASWRGDLQATITITTGSVISIRRKGGAGLSTGELKSPDTPYTIDISQ